MNRNKPHFGHRDSHYKISLNLIKPKQIFLAVFYSFRDFSKGCMIKSMLKTTVSTTKQKQMWLFKVAFKTTYLKVDLSRFTFILLP